MNSIGFFHSTPFDFLALWWIFVYVRFTSCIPVWIVLKSFDSHLFQYENPPSAYLTRFYLICGYIMAVNNFVISKEKVQNFIKCLVAGHAQVSWHGNAEACNDLKHRVNKQLSELRLWKYKWTLNAQMFELGFLVFW